ncbi:TetR/AcrR family transcriptional regulator [Sphingobium sp. MK2]|uniref:TetR/AcrR family transcriptional regulator n=1 Tax=Sphingobium sp. MK2 TaxID=3116540 RepID=UPI0032E35AF2
MRTYNSELRAQAVQRSRERAIQAFIALSGEMTLEEITLDRVAQATGVTVRTLLRHFEGKEHLVREAHDTILRSIDQRLIEDTPGSQSFVGRIVQYMEQIGDYLVRFENEASNYPSLLPDLERGREMRRAALRTMLDAHIQCDPDVRERTLLALYVVIDVYAWRIVRRDAGLDTEETEFLLKEMVNAVLRHFPYLPSRKAG